MSGRQTDHRNLNLAQFHRDVIRGEAGGKIIWQPRIGCWLQDKRFAGEKLPEPYERLTLPQIYRELGCSARIYEYNECFKRKDDPRVQRYSRNISEIVLEYMIETPVGRANWIEEINPNNWFRLIRKRWVENAEDLKVFSWMEERCSWEYNKESFDRIHAEWGDLGAPTIFMPRVNVQNLYIDLMGVEKAIYALFDFPEQVETYFRILEESHERLIHTINASPIEIINFGDNIHASTLSPALFLKYVLPSYQRRNELLHKAGKFTHAHWDGDTKSLLPFAKETGLDGIEAITPKPQGDVTLEEMKEKLGDDLFLIDGIAAILFNDMFPLKVLEDQAKKLIEYFAPKLILGISDEISSTGDIERIKFVGQIVDDYNV